MNDEITLKKSAELPQFLREAFTYVDAKDFDSLKRFFADDFRFYFAHYTLEGVTQGLGFVGAFNNRLPKYEHAMEEIFVGDNVTIFRGLLRVWLDDSRLVETPFWDKIEVDPDSGKIINMYATFSIAAVPEELWKDLKPEDFA
jgi:hypothetical protein